MAVTFLVSKCAYLNSQRLYRPISRTFSQVTFGAFMTLESRKKSSPQCVLGIFGINQGPDFHKPDTYSTWTAHPSRSLGCAVPCRPLASFAESSWDANTKSDYYDGGMHRYDENQLSRKEPSGPCWWNGYHLNSSTVAY